MVNDTRPRGIRNNNPGNIRHGTPWDGLAPQQTDPSFDQFVSPAYGVRALVKLLVAYQDFHGLKTVRGMINRWAPPVENNTSAYVYFVADHMGISPDAEFSIHNPALATAMAKAIIMEENSNYQYAAGVVEMGVAMAGLGKV